MLEDVFFNDECKKIGLSKGFQVSVRERSFFLKETPFDEPEPQVEPTCSRCGGKTRFGDCFFCYNEEDYDEEDYDAD
jgi:hypothetical protein